MKNKISAIIPVYNTSSTINICLDSLKKQIVKPREIIIVDNKSTDDSIERIEKYQKKNKNLTIKILRKPKKTSVASSYNIALKKAKGDLILTLHSDSSLPSKHEIERLIKPLINNENEKVVATYSYVLHPYNIWLSYNFWEKCQSARVVGKRIPAMNGKFDCYKKDVLLKINGFDDVNFDQFGDGNDADIYYRLKEIGKVVPTEAEIVHLHYLNSDYKLGDWINKRRNMSITAGRLLKMYKQKTDIKGLFSFFLRPFLVILPFIPPFNLIGIFFIFLFAFLYTSRMFTTKSTLVDPRILILPFINMFLIYYESYWILKMLLTHKVYKKN